ncbi:MAG: FecR domain-containing protein, partial [Myxococcales bacterium]
MKLAAFALAALFAAPPLLAQARAAQVSALEGKARSSGGGGPPAELRLGASVGQGDTIETGEGARLEIRFADGSVLRLGPGARLELSEAHFGAARAARKL